MFFRVGTVGVNSRRTLAIIDDDVDVLASLRALLESSGYGVHAYTAATEFLERVPKDIGCIVSDIRMPEIDGLRLQEVLSLRGIDIPVILITGHAMVELAVRAMKLGAFDFIEKPFDDGRLLECIDAAFVRRLRVVDRRSQEDAMRKLFDLLTPREQQVAEQIATGRANKVAAYELGISPRTVEIHRANIMKKLKTRSLADLVRIMMTVQAGAGGKPGA